MKPAAIDVIIPVYNGAAYVGQAIESALNQTYAATTIYVIDDGSTDATAETVKPYRRHHRLHYVYKANGGLSSARNHGIRVSHNPYLAFLDADDIWAKDKLAQQMALFDTTRDRKLGVVYCDYANMSLH